MKTIKLVLTFIILIILAYGGFELYKFFKAKQSPIAIEVVQDDDLKNYESQSLKNECINNSFHAEKLLEGQNKALAKLITLRELERKLEAGESYAVELLVLQKLLENEQSVFAYLNVLDKFKEKLIITDTEILNMLDNIKISNNNDDKLISSVVDKFIKIESKSNISHDIRKIIRNKVLQKDYEGVLQTLRENQNENNKQIFEKMGEEVSIKSDIKNNINILWNYLSLIAIN